MRSVAVMLRLENLRKTFDALVVTDDVTLSVSAGERHAIIGPNGAGKTSLINQIGGQLRPTRGRIFLDDDDITGLSPEEICRMGVARTFQKNNLFANLTVRENVWLAVQSHLGFQRTFHTPVARVSEVTDAAKEILAMLGLGGLAEERVGNLSYGSQRQIEIALALSSRPKLLLLDEPTSGMSPSETESVIQFIARLGRDMAIVLIEHDMEVVFSLADRITVLYFGKIVASGTPETIRADPIVRDIYLGTLE